MALDLVAQAKKTPLTRPAITELAKQVPAATLRAATKTILDEGGAHAASVVAFALVAHGQKLDPAFARALLPELESIQHFGPLVFATDASPVDIAEGIISDGCASWEREALALFLASRFTDPEDEYLKAPPKLIERARFLARHQLGSEAGILLGAAANRFEDRHLTLLATPHINRARRNKRIWEEWLAEARAPALEALSDTAGSRISTGFTVKRAEPAVGRNDPCPCGSGKKYKKCHALSEEPVSVEEPKVDAASIGPDQAAFLRPAEIAALDRKRLSRKSFGEAFKRVVDYRKWDLVLEMIAEARERSDMTKDVVPLVLDGLHKAFDEGELEPAEKLFALLPPEEQRRSEFELTCLRAPSDLLQQLEREARAALEEDANGARGMLLASALLRHSPALGIYVARGALHEGRVHDSQALLERMEDARDRLLISPFEPWWDVYDGLFDDAKDEAEEKKSHAQREKLKEELRRARAASRKAMAEVEKLQERARELEEIAPEKKQKEDKRAPEPSADVVEEKKRLKSKIDELQRIIGEGQEERRDLRRRLAEVEEAEPKPSRPEPANDEPEPDELTDEADVELPRAILIPRFSERASKAVTELAANIAELVLSLVASLAAGRPNAWGGVKQLTKVRGVFSARAGIHHRGLFKTDAGALDVVEVIHRRELEQVVTRLARAS